MVATTYGKSGLALLMVGSANLPRYCEIGSGSGAAVAGLGSNVAAVGSRVSYSSRDISVAQEVVFSFDFNSVVMSGVNLREFGIGGSAARGSNDLWVREAFPFIQFDGTNELSIDVNFDIF